MILPFVTFIIINAKISVFLSHFKEHTHIQPGVVLAR